MPTPVPNRPLVGELGLASDLDGARLFNAAGVS